MRVLHPQELAGVGTQGADTATLAAIKLVLFSSIVMQKLLTWGYLHAWESASEGSLGQVPLSILSTGRTGLKWPRSLAMASAQEPSFISESGAREEHLEKPVITLLGSD